MKLKENQRLFCDLDGVLADFDGYYRANFGVDPRTVPDPEMWKNVAKTGQWFRDLPPMADAFDLWDTIKHMNPIIISGVPRGNAKYELQKRAWVLHYLGRDTRVITCESANKSQYCFPGDIIIDDWEKHQQKWIDKGGLWVLHRSAEQSINELRTILN